MKCGVELWSGPERRTGQSAAVLRQNHRPSGSSTIGKNFGIWSRWPAGRRGVVFSRIGSSPAGCRRSHLSVSQMRQEVNKTKKIAVRVAHVVLPSSFRCSPPFLMLWMSTLHLHSAYESHVHNTTVVLCHSINNSQQCQVSNYYMHHDTHTSRRPRCHQVFRQGTMSSSKLPIVPIPLSSNQINLCVGTGTPRIMREGSIDWSLWMTQ